MRKKKYAMLFCEDIALLHTICNKQTMFFAEMISRMDGDQVVQMTPYTRKQLVSLIGSKSGAPLNVARQYLKQLSDSNLIADLGDGAYMINPRVAGFNNIAKMVEEKSDLYIRLRYSAETGERHLTVGNDDLEFESNPPPVVNVMDSNETEAEVEVESEVD